MKVIIHGATNGSNFGDFLFADIFFQKLKETNSNGENIFFEFTRFGISPFFKEKLGYTQNQKISDLVNADLLVLFSGGFFGERKGTFRENTIRFLKYVPLSLLFILRKKPIIISGVGGGPLTSKLLRKSMSFIISKALVVTVRDEETKQYFHNYGVERDIKVTSDTAQVITEDILPPLEDSLAKQLKKRFSGKKRIFLHLYGKEEIDNKYLEKIIPPLNEFINKNSEYGVVIGFDGKKNIENMRLSVENLLNCETIMMYNYDDPWQLCSLLNVIDLIITPKLHVGILGATLSKSVISLPMHKEKTERYYKQIGEPERCITLEDSSYYDISATIEKFHNKNINLSREIISKSQYNLDVIGEVLQSIKDNNN